MDRLIRWWWLILLILSIPIIWALLVPGYYGASDDLHMGWLYEMDRVIKLGQIPPRFVPDLSFGFGYPLFNFVFPLPFYIGEIFHLLGFSLVDSIKLVFLISIPLSGIFMYLLLREFIDQTLSLAGAIVYIYAPYRAVDLYVRGAAGELVAFAFLPLVALSIVKLTKDTKLINYLWVGLGAISLASLVLSHNIAVYMSLPFLLTLGLIRWLYLRSKLTAAIQTGFFLILGLSISSFFWLPALLESDLMQYETVFNFADHFPTLMQLVKPYWGYGASVPGPGDGMSFYMGLSNWSIVLVATFLLAKWFKKIETVRRVLLIWATGSFLITILMMNYRSTFIWNFLPLLPYFQFPWRFLIMSTFLMPLFLIIFEKSKYSKQIALGIVLITILLQWSYFRPQDFLGRRDDYYLNRYIPYPNASFDYTQTKEEYLRLPKNAIARPDQLYPRVFPESENIKVAELNSLDAKIETDFKSKQRVNYNKYYFPGWVANLDGQQIKIKPGSPFGQITTDVSPGVHLLEISFREVSWKMVLDLLSLGGLLLAVFLIWKFRKV